MTYGEGNVANDILPDWGNTVDEFVDREYTRKADKLFKETHGKGCGCSRCKTDSRLDFDDADDRLAWRFNLGDWNPFKAKRKGNRIILEHNGDDPGAPDSI